MDKKKTVIWLIVVIVIVILAIIAWKNKDKIMSGIKKLTGSVAW